MWFCRSHLSLNGSKYSSKGSARSVVLTGFWYDESQISPESEQPSRQSTVRHLFPVCKRTSSHSYTQLLARFRVLEKKTHLSSLAQNFSRKLHCWLLCLISIICWRRKVCSRWNLWKQLEASHSERNAASIALRGQITNWPTCKYRTKSRQTNSVLEAYQIYVRLKGHKTRSSALIYPLDKMSFSGFPDDTDCVSQAQGALPRKVTDHKRSEKYIFQ